MLSRQAAPPRAPAGGERSPSSRPWWQATLAFASVALVAWTILALSAAYLPASHAPAYRFPSRPWIEGWVHWDAGWYRFIADHGYFYTPGRQSPVAFFPAYPLAMRVVGAVLGSSVVAGIVLTVAAGATAATAVWTWFRDRLSPQAAWTALGLFLLYPYAFYLYGAVYADALFVAAVVVAFVLLEHDHVWLAALAGAVATATRPVGLVVVVGLAVRALERRGVFPRGVGPLTRRSGDGTGGRRLVHLGRARPGDAAILFSAAGLVAYCAYLAVRFGSPFLFADAERSWGQGAGPRTWLKVEFLHGVTRFGDPPAWIAYVAHPMIAIVALAFVPRVFRRFGWGYGVYCLLAVGLTTLSTKDFFGTGRYALAAFPCFAAAAESLVEHPRVRAWVLGGSAVALAVLTSFFARGSYLA